MRREDEPVLRARYSAQMRRSDHRASRSRDEGRKSQRLRMGPGIFIFMLTPTIPG